jgi:Scaffold protein Nfu/NifU N terminal
MGQLVAVVEKPSPRPGVIRFEANRSLTGMGHERFTAAEQAVGPRPAASLARELFATGAVDAVHIYGNMITVELARGYDTQGLGDVVRDMYQYWKPGMEPTFEAPPEEPAAAAPAATGDGGGGADSEYLRRVPAQLVERSRAALAKATAG